MLAVLFGLRNNKLMLVRKRGTAALKTKINTIVPRVGAQQQKNHPLPYGVIFGIVNVLRIWRLL